MVSRLASQPSCPGFDYHRSLNFSEKKIIDITEANQRYWWTEWPKNVNRTHLVLGNGRPVQQKHINI